jgi:hypothetical protein
LSLKITERQTFFNAFACLGKERAFLGKEKKKSVILYARVNPEIEQMVKVVAEVMTAEDQFTKFNVSDVIRIAVLQFCEKKLQGGNK